MLILIEYLGVLPKWLGKQSVQTLLCHDKLCSENGQFCAIKEVQVISDDPHSKERLKQLNQVTCLSYYAVSLLVFLYSVTIFSLPVSLTQ